MSTAQVLYSAQTIALKPVRTESIFGCRRLRSSKFDNIDHHPYLRLLLSPHVFETASFAATTLVVQSATERQMTSLLISESQPWKTLYLIWFFATLILVKLPAWFIWYLVPSHRPRRSWTIKRALIVRTIRELWTLEVDIDDEKRDPSEEVPDSELTDAKFVWVDGIPDKLFCGEVHRIADITNVRPTRIAGYWLFQKNYDWTGPRAKLGEKTILHLHGGAFYVSHTSPLLA